MIQTDEINSWPMLKMECEKCIHGRRMKPGEVYRDKMTISVSTGNSIRCTNSSIRRIDVRGDEMYCSDFKERDDQDGRSETDPRTDSAGVE